MAELSPEVVEAHANAERAVAQAVAELGYGHYKKLPTAKREQIEDRALELLREWERL